MLSDLRLAVRQLAKSPVFTAVAVLSLAVGIGAGTAVFSLVNAVLLRSLPVPKPEELRAIGWSGRELRIPSWVGGASVSPPTFAALRERAKPLADVFGFVPLDDVIARVEGPSFTASGAMVSDNYLSGLRVHAVAGRALAPGDDYVGAGTSVALSHGFWERHLGRDPAVVGRSVTLNGTPYAVVGVLPRGFIGVEPGRPSDFYVPLSAASRFLYVPITSRFHWYVRVMARLRPGIRDTQLAATLGPAFAEDVGEAVRSPRVLVEPGAGGISDSRDDYGRSLMLLLGVVALVTLAACANLAGLLLARGAARERELAVRSALGAGRLRLVRQALAESLVLALLGGGLGVALAAVVRFTIARLLAGSAGEWRYESPLDATVLGFGLSMAFVTALLSGGLPAVRAALAAADAGLKSRGAMASRRVGVGRALVAAQVGLSLLLLTGAGLYLRTLINLARVDVGFDTENLLLFQVHPRGSRSADADPAAFYERMQEALVALPGARGATLLDFPLLHNASSSGGFTLSGRSADTSLDTRRIRVGETFFTTMGIPVVQGRAFDAGDTVAAPKAVVVNEAFARKHLAGEDALGRSLRMWEADWQIVGVCRDAKYSNLRQATPPTAYFLSRQMFYSRFARSHLRQPYFAVRTSLPPLSLAPAVRQAVAAVDADVALSHFTTQEAVRNRGMGRERLFAALCGSLAVVAVLLSCIGLYALLAYHVARHKGDIAVRMAVGAQPAEVARQVVREALLLASVGVAVGLPLLAALGRYVRSQLYGVRPDDPLTLATVVLALVLVAGLSAWIPARRAARVDPMVALRCE